MRPARVLRATCRLQEHGAESDTRPQWPFVNDSTAARRHIAAGLRLQPDDPLLLRMNQAVSAP